MCQLNAVVEEEGGRETIMEGVTALEVVADGVVLSTYFEEPLTVPGVRIRRIDFLGGSVLQKKKKQSEYQGRKNP